MITVQPVALTFTRTSSEGTNDKTTVLFIHGKGSTKNTWQFVLDSLKDDYDCYAIDLRGHGESTYDGIDYSVESVVNDVHSFVVLHHLTKFALVGHSMGGRVAVSFAAHHPELLSTLIIEDMVCGCVWV